MKIEGLKILSEEYTCHCKGQFWIGETLDDQTPCIIHTIPYCNEFENKDVLEFLQWFNKTSVN